MKTFNRVCAQGDVMAVKISSLPKGAVKVAPEGNVNIVTHSETGHHHVMDARVSELYQLPNSILNCLLVVHEPTTLEHLRSFDTHEPILFEPGIYDIRRQREHSPEGWRKVQD